jgi:anti-sigma B factor antagonist
MSTSTACLAGEWTIHAIAQHREAMLLLVNGGQYEFDASGITDMDSAGLQLLMAAQRSIAKQGHELRLMDASSAVKDVLKAYGLDATLLPVNLEETVS